ncbi:hypothetical protein DOTSEDRAFT_83405 [Dothistroma septosporum NZE10]|uniref:Uncharacterized protein n=1 Tax=Dothistroma septosporum (strain NZE10 / CBS 128990) TaxID=675120 RepID=M2Y016_DOTSN|nr:hypothetical protein DOTSEDRAFT_83405 [Dothistroma septosporum NZE10]
MQIRYQQWRERPHVLSIRGYVRFTNIARCHTRQSHGLPTTRAHHTQREFLRPRHTKEFSTLVSRPRERCHRAKFQEMLRSAFVILRGEVTPDLCYASPGPMCSKCYVVFQCDTTLGS